MFTGLQLRITVPDDVLTGEAQLLVWRQDGSQMIESVRPYQGVTILPTLSESGSHYAWAVTCLRDVVDRAVAHLLEQMGEGKEKPMLVHEKDQISS